MKGGRTGLTKTATLFALLLAAVIQSVLFITPEEVHAQVTTSSAVHRGWIPNGEVKATAVSGDYLYIGGSFTKIAPYSHVAMLDSVTGYADTTFPAFTAQGVQYGKVECIVADGEGGWYVGGNFSYVGGNERQYVAHILSDNSVDPDWATTLNGSPLSMAVDGEYVYLGGVVSLWSTERHAIELQGLVV